MCGRFTVKATWAELVALYRLTMNAPPHNLRPRYNVCPTDPVDVVTASEGKRELATMRWELVPWWWSKPLKELRMATFNARAETVETKPVFRDAKRSMPGMATKPLGSFKTQLLRFRILAHCQAAGGTHEAT
jgi:putative SOS response-associated peptidase YedK